MFLFSSLIAKIKVDPYEIQGDKLNDEFLWFDQILDHFDNTNLMTFKQRYLVNSTWFKQGGPAFVIIGGEGPLSPAKVTDAFSPAYFAKELGGLVVGFEHRFYGESFPKNDSAIQYLSSKQAIADYSTFLPFIKEKYNVTKIVVVGGSYPGNMAAWLRAQLPFIVDGAISSSGPLLAKNDFHEYLTHILAQFETQDCQKFVKSNLAYGQSLIFGDASQQQELIQALKLTKHKDLADFEELDKWNLMENLVDTMAGLVQYAAATDFDGKGTVGDLVQFCKDYEPHFSESQQVQFSKFAECKKFDGIRNLDLSYKAFVNSLKSETRAASRNWFWQTCTEFGFYQTSKSSDNEFDVPLKYFTQTCYDAFFKDLGIQEAEVEKIVDDMIEESNIWYGARNIPRDNVFYVNGDVDPWSELSMRQELSWKDGQMVCKDCKNVLIKGGSHCTDMKTAWKMNDGVRSQQLESIRQWLGLK